MVTAPTATGPDGVPNARGAPPGDAAAEAERGLVARAAAGDGAAWAALVAEHQSRVAGLAARLLGWRGDVDDAVQDVFVAVLEGLPRFRGASRLSTWLFRLTVSVCRRRQRRRLAWLRWWRRRGSPDAAAETRSAVSEMGGPAGEMDDAAAATVAAERQARVRAAVGRLPQVYREVIVLRYLEELDPAEIGEVLGLKRSALDVRLSRAREKLRSELAGELEA